MATITVNLNITTTTVPEGTNLYFTESRVLGTDLAGLSITGGSVVSTDTILQAFGKVQNQINGLIGGSIIQGVWNATTNSPALSSSVGTTGHYYVVSVAGSTNLDGITDWKVGDWAIFINGVWNKVDNTDAVSSVNGAIGAVSLAGTSNRISVSGTTWDIDTNYAGQTSITTLGTITTGTLGNGAKILVGSDATGDIWYNGGSGAISRSNSLNFTPANKGSLLAKGTDGGGIYLGSYNATYGGIWSANVTPTTSTYALATDGTETAINAGTNITLNIAGTIYGKLTSAGLFVGGSTTPTATLHIKAGTTAAGSAPIKLTSGTSMTTAEAGAIEFTTDDLFFTITTGAVRKRLLMADQSAGLTYGTTPVATTNGRLTDGLILGDGTYTPTLTAGTNVSSTGALQCQYFRVGNSVTVYGAFTLQATAGVGNASNFEMSLPIASDFSAIQNCGGNAQAVPTVSGDTTRSMRISASIANNRAYFDWKSYSTSNDTYSFTFTYYII